MRTVCCFFVLITVFVSAQVPLGRTWERVDARDDAYFNGVCAFGDEVLAVGDGGSVWTSGHDGNWILEETFTTGNLHGIAKSQNTTIAVGEGGMILLKEEGDEWIEVFSGVNSTLREVVFGGGIFVVAGDGGVVLKSPDGLEWDRWETGTFESLRALEWNGERFFVLSRSLLLIALPNQEIWLSVPLQPGVFGQSRDTLVAGPDRVSIETDWSYVDLQSWEESSGSSDDLIDGAFGAGVYLGCTGNNRLASSENARQWEYHEIGVAGEILSVDWSGSSFVVVTDRREILTSSDGYLWTRKQLPFDTESVVELNGRYFVSTESSVLASSPDGEVWTVNLRSPGSGAMVSGGGRICMIAEGRLARVTSDGETWEEVGLPAGFGYSGPSWTGEEFLITDFEGGIWSSQDGLEWRLKVPGSLDQVIWDGSRFVGVGSRHAVVSNDGETWEYSGDRGPKSTASWARMNDMIKMEGGYVAVGDQGLVLSSSDGVDWFQVRNFRDTRSTTNLKAIAHSDFAVIAVGQGEIWRSRRFREMFEMVLVEGAPFFTDIVWSGSVFVTVGGGKIYSSADGFDWALVHDWPAANLQSVAWSGTEWLVSGSLRDESGVSSGFVATSPDLENWNVENGPVGVSFDDVTILGEGHFVSASNGTFRVFSNGAWLDEDPGLVGAIVSVMETPDGVWAYSDDGMVSRRSSAGVWTPGHRRVRMARVRTLVSGEGAMLALGLYEGVRFSSDGLNWDLIQITEDFEDAVWFDGRFRAIAGNTIYSLNHSAVWEVDSVIEDSFLQSLEVFQGRLFAAGNSGGGRAVWEQVNEEWVLQHAIKATNQRRYELKASPLFMIATEKAILIGDITNSQITANGTEWDQLSEPAITGRTLNAVIHTPFGFVAAGESRILRSDDGQKWETVFVSPGDIFNELTYANGIVVAVGSEIVTSEDGVNWQWRSGVDLASPFQDVAWGDGVFLAVGGGFAATSQDGIEWLKSTALPQLERVNWDGEKWVGATTVGEAVSSFDGVEWSIDSFAVTEADVVFSSGKYFANSHYGVLHSDDGLAWSQGARLQNGNILSGGGRFDVVNGKLFYIDSNTGTAVIGEDGVSWDNFSWLPFRSLAWDGQRYLGTLQLPGFGAAVVSFVEGGTPVPVETNNGPEFSNDSLWTGDQLVVVGDGGSIKSSPDAGEWETIDSGTDEDLLKVEGRESGFVILTAGGSLITLDGPLALPEGFLARDFLLDDEERIIVSGDHGQIAVEGDNGWTLVETGSDVSLGSIAWTGANYMAIGGPGTVIGTETNQATGPWAVRSSYPGFTGRVTSFEKNGNRHEMIGSDGGILSSEDGRLWTRAGLPGISGVTAKLRLEGEQLIFTEQGRIVRVTVDGRFIDEFHRGSSGLNAAASSGSRLVAVGADGVIFLSKSGDEVADGFDRWMAGQGAIVSGFRAEDDWDRDGVVNMMEYLHGFSSSRTNPQNVNSRLPQLISSDGMKGLQVEIQTENQDLVIQVQQSSDMVNWRVIAEKKGRGFWAGEAIIQEVGGSQERSALRFFPASDDGRLKFYRISARRR